MRAKTKAESFPFTDVLQVLPLVFGTYVLFDAWIAADAEQLQTTLSFLLQLITHGEVRIDILPQIILGVLITTLGSTWMIARIHIYNITHD